MENKYLEKIAELREDLSMGKAKAPNKAMQPGKNLSKGAKTLFSKAMFKHASENKLREGAKETLNVGTIAGLGGAASAGVAHAAAKIHRVGAVLHSPKRMALAMTGAGIVADYAGLKINKAVNKGIDSITGNKS